MSGWTSAFAQIMRELSAENASLNPARVQQISLVIGGIEELQNDHIRVMNENARLREEFRDLERKLKSAGYVI